MQNYVNLVDPVKDFPTSTYYLLSKIGIDFASLALNQPQPLIERISTKPASDFGIYANSHDRGRFSHKAAGESTQFEIRRLLSAVCAA